MATTDLFGKTYDPRMSFTPSPLQGSLPKDPYGTGGAFGSSPTIDQLMSGIAKAPTFQSPTLGNMNQGQMSFQSSGSNSLGQTTPWSSGVNPTAPLGAPTSAGNVSYGPVGPQETLMDKLFGGALTGQGGGPIGNMLYSLGQGILPGPLRDMITATTNDQFGKLGARFGTDLGTAVSRGLGQAGSTQALNAINSIIGLGGTTAGFEFQRGEHGMDRALQEFLQGNNQDSTMQLLQMLLGGG